MRGAGLFTGLKKRRLATDLRSREEQADARDITERDWAWITIQHAATIVESSHDAITSKDARGFVTSWNPGAERLYGYTASEVIGRSTEVLIPPGHEDELASILDRVWRGEIIPSSMETIRIRKDRTLVPVSLTISAIRDGAGQIIGACTVARDITERKNYEAILATERRRLRSAQTIGRIGSWERDLETDTLTWSETMFDLYGVDRDGTPGALRAGIKARIHPDDREGVDSAMAACVETGAPLSVRYRLTRPNDGQLRWLEVRAERVSENGRPVRVEGAAADVTEQITAAQEIAEARDMALEASRQKSAFLATMSHEIRTPMNAVIGMTGLLLDTVLDDDQREFVETVRTSGDSLLCIINDILDFSKIEAGGLELEQQPFDLRSCVEDSLELVAATSNSKGLELAGDVDANCPSRVVGDVTRLRQVLVNLLGNAVKFTAQGEVVLSVEPVGNSSGELALRFAVADTGIGIPPDRVASLFDSFSQVDASTTRLYGGTGLGLAISNRLVEAMGGTLGVNSKPSVGSTFHFSVSLPSAAPVTEVAGLPRATTLDGRSVLVVDDNPTNRRILRLQLEGWGTSVIEAESGNAAIALVESGAQFDVAVVDMKMPGMTGQELAVWLRSSPTARHVPILLLSSRMDRPAFQPDDLFSSVLTKPVRSARLRHSLRNALLPDGRPSTVSAVFEASAGSKHGALRVLLAEDNAVNQRLGRLMLEKLGCHVDVVGNGQEAVGAVLHIPYDVVLMDVEMPEMDGLEATRAIRRQLAADRQPQIVAMTARALVEDRHACTEAGMDDYLAKPVRLQELDAALTRAAVARKVSTTAPGKTTASGPDPSGERATHTDAIDAHVIDTLVGDLGNGGAVDVAELIVSYLDDSGDQIAAIHAAHANHDLQIVVSVAHKLESSTARLGATAFAGLLNATCVTARVDGVGLDHLLERLDQEYRQVVWEMTEELHRLDPAAH
jgi:PAS domain S-box-containing protein